MTIACPKQIQGASHHIVFFLELAGTRKESNDHGHVLYNDHQFWKFTRGMVDFWILKRLRHSHKVVKAWDVYRCRQIYERPQKPTCPGNNNMIPSAKLT